MLGVSGLSLIRVLCIHSLRLYMIPKSEYEDSLIFAKRNDAPSDSLLLLFPFSSLVLISLPLFFFSSICFSTSFFLCTSQFLITYAIQQSHSHQVDFPQDASKTARSVCCCHPVRTIRIDQEPRLDCRVLSGEDLGSQSLQSRSG